MSLQDGVSAVYPEDYLRVVEVWEASVRATHHFVSASDIKLFRPMVYAALPDVELGAVRDENGFVIGFIGLTGKHIDMLFIHPDWRGQGTGRRLIRFAVDERDATTVDVNEQNDQAVGFYLNMGFEVESRSELDGLGKPYPLLHMRLSDGNVK